jgi:hypothetical protein
MRGTPLSTVSAPCKVLMNASEAHSRVAGKDVTAAKQRPRSRAAGAAPPAPLLALPTVPRAANPAVTQQPKFWLGAPEAVHPRYDRLQHADMDLGEARALRQRLQRAYQPRRPRQRLPAAFLGTFQRRANHSCPPPRARPPQLLRRAARTRTRAPRQRPRSTARGSARRLPRPCAGCRRSCCGTFCSGTGSSTVTPWRATPPRRRPSPRRT